LIAGENSVLVYSTSRRWCEDSTGTSTPRIENVANEQFDTVSQASWISDGDGAHDQTLVENWLFRLRRERFRSRKSGKTHDFYVTHLADGVHAVALTSDRQVVMVRQFRAGSRHDSLETPGGLLERGENPCIAGARELLEETGYAGDPPELLGAIWPIPALLSMRISTVVIRNARLIAEPRPDQNEELVVEIVPHDDIPALIQNGRIDHGVCVAGLLWWLMLDRA
jgi:ADP-ribose pyrophosphatase